MTDMILFNSLKKIFIKEIAVMNEDEIILLNVERLLEV